MNVVVCLVLGPLLVGGSMAAAATPTPARASKCCFANQQYTGICKVIPGKDETCASILAYLNNPIGAGKTYCGGTPIRGGWAFAVCEPKHGSTATVGPGEPVGIGLTLQDRSGKATFPMTTSTPPVTRPQPSDQR